MRFFLCATYSTQARHKPLRNPSKRIIHLVLLQMCAFVVCWLSPRKHVQSSSDRLCKCSPLTLNKVFETSKSLEHSRQLAKHGWAFGPFARRSLHKLLWTSGFPIAYQSKFFVGVYIQNNLKKNAHLGIIEQKCNLLGSSVEQQLPVTWHNEFWPWFS